MKKHLLDKRKLSYLINDWDDLNLPFTINDNDIASQVVDFFCKQSELVYPAKSYFVAIVYARCLENFFHEDFYECLSDKDLLPDDKFFKTYIDSQEIYDSILTQIKDPLTYKSVEKTVSYFKKEFLIGTNNQTNRPL